MALELPYGYKNLNPDGSSNVDEAYGYYDSISEALQEVPLAMRKGGRTVGIKQADGKITEYWWENDNDLTDSGLVVKTAGGDFNPAEHDLDEFQNESANPYVRENQIPDPFDPTQLENDIQNLKDTKVDKDGDKQLSDENFSLEEKDKLANIEEGAQVNVIPDWDADTDNPRRIDNKPTKTSDFINDGATGVSPYAEIRDVVLKENVKQNLTEPDEDTVISTAGLVALQQVEIITSNTVITPTHHTKDIITEGFTCTISPSTQSYQNSFECGILNDHIDISTLVLGASTGWTYDVNGTLMNSGTVYIKMHGTIGILRKGNQNKIYVRGDVV